MSSTVALKNFQVYPEARLTFDPGLTIITGANSSGKSSIIRAIRTLINNSSHAKRYIRSGTDTATVALQLEDQPVVYWQRGKEGASYKVGDKVFTKLGKSKLHDLAPDFPLLRDDSGNCLNISDEWTTMFPFNYSSSELFKLFESLFVTSATSVVEEIRRDELDTRHKQTEVQAAIDSSKSRIEYVDTVIQGVSLSEIERLKEAVKNASEGQKTYRADLTRVKLCQVYSEFELPDCPDISRVETYFAERGDVLAAVQAEQLTEIQFREPAELNLDAIFALEIELNTCSEIENRIKSVLQTGEEYERERAAIEAELAEFKTCPLCGAGMGGNS
jgi:DNA repair exonuclease SbcCD ATPase subunit